MNQTIQFQLCHVNARKPSRASAHAAGFDLTAADSRIEGGQVIVHTGLMVAFPEDMVLEVYGRSGFAFKHDIFLTNGVGIIDADYRGEIKLAFSSTTHNADQMIKVLAPGVRVAQAILRPLIPTFWAEATELPDTIRGAGGFGSSGTR